MTPPHDAIVTYYTRSRTAIYAYAFLETYGTNGHRYLRHKETVGDDVQYITPADAMARAADRVRQSLPESERATMPVISYGRKSSDYWPSLAIPTRGIIRRTHLEES